MERCESKTGGACPRAATWRQAVHAGDREAGRFLCHAYWCDEHAARIADRRRRDLVAPPRMARIVRKAP